MIDYTNSQHASPKKRGLAYIHGMRMDASVADLSPRIIGNTGKWIKIASLKNPDFFFQLIMIKIDLTHHTNWVLVMLTPQNRQIHNFLHQ